MVVSGTVGHKSQIQFPGLKSGVLHPLQMSIAL